MDLDIINLPIEYDRQKIDSRYRLSVIASQRARELALGAPPLIQTKAKKVTTQALIETATYALEFLTGKEAVAQIAKAEGIDMKKMFSSKKRHIEDFSELEKDLKVYLHERAEDSDAGFDELFSDVDESDSK